MKSMKLVSLVLLAAASGCSSDTNCDTPGTACIYAGVDVRGFNIENPTAHRLESKLYYPEDITFGPDGRSYILDWNNHRVRRVEADDSLVTVMGTDYEGDGPPHMEDRFPLCAPVGAPGPEVALNHMTDAEFGPDGKLYVAAWHNNKIRVLDPDTLHTVSLAGDGYGYTGDGGQACTALFNTPKSIAFDETGTLYTIDQRNVRIRSITPDGRIDTFAGTGTLGNAGDGGLAKDAQWGFETGTTPRPAGALVIQGHQMYVADSLNNRIRRIDMDSGIVDCIAGDVTATAGYTGDGGPALKATFDFPMDMEMGPDGRLYVADRNNHAIRAIDLRDGTIQTVAGGQKCDNLHASCPVDGHDALDIGLNQPYGIGFDAAGNLYIADTHNSRVIRVAGVASAK